MRRLSFLAIPLFLTACTTVNCPLENKVLAVYKFYASARTSDGVFVPGQAVEIADTLNITVLPTDTVIVNKLVNKGEAKLPVSLYGDVDTLQFTYTDTLGAIAYDTLHVSKINHHHVDDPSCPINMFHTITGITHTRHVIDTVIINHADINYNGLENFQIYFRTATDE